MSTFGGIKSSEKGEGDRRGEEERIVGGRTEFIGPDRGGRRAAPEAKTISQK